MLPFRCLNRPKHAFHQDSRVEQERCWDVMVPLNDGFDYGDLVRSDKIQNAQE